MQGIDDNTFVKRLFPGLVIWLLEPYSEVVGKVRMLGKVQKIL